MTSSSQLKKKALQAIQKRGALLVYPLANRVEPLSIWSELFPRSPMRWEWDAEGDNRVANLWRLREELSRSGEVVYSKWFQGRATFFSPDVFVHLLGFLEAESKSQRWMGNSREVLDILREDSPLSTKQLKVAASLEGRLQEASYNRALKPLWQNLQIVGYGEFEDSSFPSLGVGSTALLFEDLWRDGSKIASQKGEKFLLQKLGSENPFYKFAVKAKKSKIPLRPLNEPDVHEVEP